MSSCACSPPSVRRCRLLSKESIPVVSCNAGHQHPTIEHHRQLLRSLVYQIHQEMQMYWALAKTQADQSAHWH